MRDEVFISQPIDRFFPALIPNFFEPRPNNGVWCYWHGTL
jgi:hypothetical protein